MVRGDHIYTNNPSFIGAPVIHHGIDLGDGTVVHYAKCEATYHYAVVRTTIAAFSKGGLVEDAEAHYQALYNIHNHPLFKNRSPYFSELENYVNTTSFSPDVVVQRALYALDQGRVKYSSLQNNCEHFATFVKKGIPFSEQTLMTRYGSDTSESNLHMSRMAAEQSYLEFSSFPKTGNGRNYLHTSSDCFYLEHYQQAYVLPPTWYVGSSSSGPWEEIDQRCLPYSFNRSLPSVIGL
ncbi:MAG TPA: lecithin retinol acyltransferase family protein [Elainellaceae cyanobacterium]